MKRIALVLVLVLALLICGCTPTTSDSGETTAPNSSNETTAPNNDNTETTGPNSTATAHTHCACSGATVHAAANHTCADIAYEPWNLDTSVAATEYYIQGSYYLTENVTVDARLIPTGDLHICLNGYELTFQDLRFNTVATVTEYTMNISDCSAGNTGKMTGTVKQMIYNTSSSTSNPDAIPATINVWAGTISNTATNTLMGHIFQLGGTCTGNNELNIYGGNIIGGPVSNQGGVMRLSVDTVCNIYGGTITGGTATSTASKAAQGGNIYVTGDESQVNIYGGAISGGVAAVGTEAGAKTAQGGNIYMYKGTLTLYGGSVSSGQDLTNDNIYIAANANVKIVSVDAETKITVASGITPNVSELNSNTTVTNEGSVYTATKTGA